MAADGKIVIDVILEDGQVAKGVANIDNKIAGLGGTGKKSALGIGKIASALGLVYVAKKGIDMVRSSLDGAIDRYDTLNQFPKVMQMIGFDANDAEGAIQKLSDGIQGLPTRLDSVASTAQNIAIMTGDLDGAVDTTLALNNAFLASGASTSDAQRGLQQYVQMLSKGEVDLQSWRTLQETMGVALNQLAKDFGFTGASAQNDLYDALKSGEITFDEFNKKLIEASTAQGGFADMAMEASGGIKTSWANIKTAFVSGTAKIIQALDEALGGVGSIEALLEAFKVGVQNAFTFIADYVPVVVGAIGKVVDVVKMAWDALEPIHPILKEIAKAAALVFTALALWEGLQKIISVVRAAVTLLNSTLLLNPWTWVAIAAVAAVMLIIKYWEPIKEFFIKLWESIKEGAVLVWQYIMDRWGPHIEALKQLVSGLIEFYVNVWTSIYNFIQPVIERIIEFIMNIWNTLKDWWSESQEGFLDIALTLWNGIREGISTAISAVTDFIMDIWGQLVEWWIQHGQMIQDAAMNVWNFIYTIISGIVTALWTVIQFAFDLISTIVLGVFNAILAAVEFVWPFILNTITFVIDAIWAIMQFIWPLIQWLIVDTWNAIKNVIQGALDVILGIIQFFAALFTGNWTELWEATKQIFTGALQLLWGLINLWFVGKILKVAKSFAKLFGSVIRGAWNAIKSLFTAGVNVAKNVVSTGFNFIRNTISTIMNVVRNIISTVWNAIRSLISTVLNGIRNTVSTVWNGIRSTISSVVNAIRSVISSVFNAIRSLISSIMNGVRSTISSVWNGIRSTISSVTNSIRSTVSSVFNSLRNVVSSAMNGVRNAVSNGMRGALNVVTNIGSSFFNAGKNIVTSIANGIKGAIGKVTGAISDVTSKIRSFLPFSPAKEGALRDIMKVRISESIGEAIEKGEGSAIKSMRSLTKGLNDEIDADGDLLGDIRGVTATSLIGPVRSITSPPKSETTDSDGTPTTSDEEKQPAIIKVYVGTKKIATEIVDDITTLQKRKKRRTDKNPKPGGAY